MSKFLILFHDRWDPQPEIMAAWQKWFQDVGDRFVDSGNPLGEAREVMRAGSRQLGPASDVATGYAIVSAESLDEAERLLEGCPFQSSVRIHAAVAM